MENGPFIDDFPMNTSIYKGFSMAMLNNQMVTSIFTTENHWNRGITERSHPISVRLKQREVQSSDAQQ
jgi:hypothetical protein